MVVASVGVPFLSPYCFLRWLLQQIRLIDVCEPTRIMVRAIVCILGFNVAICFDEAEHADVEFCDVDTDLRHCWTNSCVFSFA